MGWMEEGSFECHFFFCVCPSLSGEDEEDLEEVEGELWGQVHMTSSNFLGFWTLSLPLVRTKSTQPPSLWSEFG